MIKFTEAASIFLKGFRRNKVSLTGMIIISVTFPLLIICALLDVLEVIRSPLFGAWIYGILAPLFILGHGIFFIGFFFIGSGPDKESPCSYRYIKDHFSHVTERTNFRKLIFLASFLAVGNFVVVVLVGYTGHHYSETERFCGTLCHNAMSPESGAHEISPHSRVACVDCHVGSGMKNFVSSKIAGIRQVVAVTIGSYSRPIRMPTHGLRPARETCEECHRPELFHGDKLKILDRYEEDEKNTHLQTVLLLKLGSGGQGIGARGIHWHVSNQNKIIYTYEGESREHISEVHLFNADGSEVIFKNPEVTAESHSESLEHGSKEMDCVDCHNRPAHIYLSPGEALDQRIANGMISTELPFIKQKGMELITAIYPSKEQALQEIASALPAWYAKQYPELAREKGAQIIQAAASLQKAYRDNIYPDMKIDWNTYQSNLGHHDDGGCFRCHNDTLEAADGSVIPQDCETCHILLAEDESDPEIIRSLRGD
jgi:hypothetical protein